VNLPRLAFFPGAQELRLVKFPSGAVTANGTTNPTTRAEGPADEWSRFSDQLIDLLLVLLERLTETQAQTTAQLCHGR
jgi:hypothetical protein